MGQMQWTKKDESKFLSIEHQLADGLAFTMTKVSLIKESKEQYTQSPIQIVVGVGGTQCSPVPSSKNNGDAYPEPLATIAECSLLIHLARARTRSRQSLW